MFIKWRIKKRIMYIFKNYIRMNWSDILENWNDIFIDIKFPKTKKNTAIVRNVLNGMTNKSIIKIDKVRTVKIYDDGPEWVYDIERKVMYGG